MHEGSRRLCDGEAKNAHLDDKIQGLQEEMNGGSRLLRDEEAKVADSENEIKAMQERAAPEASKANARLAKLEVRELQARHARESCAEAV